MIYAFIPARGGSSRLKDKNYLEFKGKVLFEWSIAAAERSKFVDKLIFSSDSEKYIKHTNKLNYKKEIIIDKRSSINASSKNKIYDYLKTDFIQNNKYLSDEDYIVMLLPTQPFRSVSEIDNVIKYGLELNQNIFTCREYDFPISFAFTLSDNLIKTQLLKTHHYKLATPEVKIKKSIFTQMVLYIFYLSKHLNKIWIQFIKNLSLLLVLHHFLLI